MSPRRQACELTKQTKAWLVFLIAMHAIFLVVSAVRNSPTKQEPASLASGLYHWRYGRFDLFCVNPPVVRCIAAAPCLIVGVKEDWRRLDTSAGARSEFGLGFDFVQANQARSQFLIVLARIACIPISIFGALVCFYWSRGLFRSNPSGLIAVSLWCFDPNIIAHGSLATNDCAGASLGVGAAYTFWRWLNCPRGSRALVAGHFTGLAVLSKLTWLTFFCIWPLAWLLVACLRLDTPNWRRLKNESSQLFLLLATAVCTINLGYFCEGSFTPLRDFEFVSHTLAGDIPEEKTGNRFANAWVGWLPVPFPRSFVTGIDLQKRDHEDYPQPSYLRGAWKNGGWWYYYLYGLLVKSPIGTSTLFAIGLLGICDKSSGFRRDDARLDHFRRVLVLALPPCALILLVSSQMVFNHHVRYVLPVLPFIFISASATWPAFCGRINQS